MADTPNLGITLMSAAQAQKHVTFNEAMQDIDDLLGGAAMLKTVTEELAGLSGASVTTTVYFPNQCIVLGASVRVTAAIVGATSFDCGDGSSASRFGGTLGVALGSTNQGTVGPAGNYSDTSVVLTANGGNFTGGSVKVSLHYIELTIPAA
ncbi:Rnase [Desulfofustis phage LS06-2018-MD02]|jgi:hypothetical protein|nr:Rnase [Desulfofustis phage LS06-2018-MD02]